MNIQPKTEGGKEAVSPFKRGKNPRAGGLCKTKMGIAKQTVRFAPPLGITETLGRPTRNRDNNSVLL
jgi:hypothetical protein